MMKQLLGVDEKIAPHVVQAWIDEGKAALAQEYADFFDPNGLKAYKAEEIITVEAAQEVAAKIRNGELPAGPEFSGPTYKERYETFRRRK